MSMARNFDIIVWGATGFTGKLAAQYLSEHYNQVGGVALKWAIAGRNRAKLVRPRVVLCYTTLCYTAAEMWNR